MTAWFKKALRREDGMAGADEGRELSGAGEDEDGELAVDVFQDADNIIVKSTIAGVKPEDLDINLSSTEVTISGERQRAESVKDEDYFFQECYWGAFSRTVALPTEIDVDRADADLKDGILTLTLPKASRARTKKVRVKRDEE